MDDPDAGSSETVRKRAWLDEHYITIVRCHDVWDAIPDIGMPYAWGEYLGKLREIGFDGAVSIEHEDRTLGAEEGFRMAAAYLRTLIG